MLVGFALASIAEAACPSQGPVQWYQLERVVDGDTVHLEGGLKVRVLGLNAPELGRGKPGQPMAQQARRAAVAFFGDNQRVGLQLGSQDRDHYGRTLAHVFNQQGDNLAASLLAQGMAWLVVIAPNTRYADCLAQQRQQARTALRGVWSVAEYQPLNASQMQPGMSGFMRVRGKISKVTTSRKSWWLEMGKLAIRISRDDEKYFPVDGISSLLGQTLTVSGWVVDRSDSRSVKTRNYPPFMVTVSHPLMLQI
jgi:endonuclease YncB( thermonuclease family)